VCGIAGVVDAQGEKTVPDVLEGMAAVMKYRGPDDQGLWTVPGVGMCHRRLSIIDLTAAGRQPMSNEDGSIHLVYNGEIYNYGEIADELTAAGHRFRSHTDSEVVVHAWEEWGAACLHRFNGMFAFALWDGPDSTLFAARDRLGIKPFYFHFDGRRFIFASEVKALLRHPQVMVEPDLDAVRQYLLHSHPVDDRTWYRGIRQLLPGCSLLLRNGEMETRPYWDLRFEIDTSRSPGSFAEELRVLVRDSVRLRLRSDVPVGAHLSGGVDSSSIVALMASDLPQMHTFSAAYAEGSAYDERKYIDIVSRRFRTRHHVVTPSSSDLPALLPRLIWHLDEPVIGPAILPMYRVSQMVRENGVLVVSGGQGADEIFGGYPPFFTLAARNLVADLGGRRGSPWSELVRIPAYVIQGGSFARWKGRFRREGGVEWLREAGRPRDRLVAAMEAQARAHPELGPFELASYRGVKHYLRGLLHQEDRMSMAWSVESRVPLLDYRIVELAGRMPSWIKIRDGVSKRVLRDAARGITPDPILDRKDKQGYPVPIAKWFAGDLAGYLHRTLGESPLAAADVLDSRGVAAMVRDHTEGRRDCSDRLWLALNTELWFRGLAGGWREEQEAATLMTAEQGAPY
jgi:asparagine synthase (glutamine-hydrolysing)